METGEKIINTWTILYAAPGGGRYNGKLTVTNKRLLYDAKFDVSTRRLIDEALFIKWGSEEFVAIPKERITKVEVSKKLFAKKVIVTLDNSTQHVFNYGMLNVDPVAKAIMQTL